MPQHALVTGPITGRIPHADGFHDVTPDVLYFDTEDEAKAVADSIEAEHAARGTHPVQTECAVLSQHADEFPEATHQAHRAAHAALNEKAGL
jgi:hypothetical protein